MELKKVYQWIRDLDFRDQNPQHFVIMGVEQEEKDVILLMSGSVGFRQISLWGTNQNNLVDALGGNTDYWIGKKISISMAIDPSTNKKIKTIEVNSKQ